MTENILILETEAPFYAARIAAACPGARPIPVTAAAAALAVCADAQVVIALAHEVSQTLVDAMPRLRWIQALTTGTDHLATLRLPTNVVVTSGRGVHGPQMAELAFLHMIALSRNFRGMLDNQARAHWQRWPQRLLLGKTAVLLGVGSISEAVAARCQVFGMRVLGVSSGRSSAPFFERIVPRARMHDALAEADFLIVLAPYTPQTHHIVDAAALAALPPRAVVINLARGSVIDEPALIAALSNGTIAGAGLDVFETEPLPAANPLWSMPNVIVTPHVGGMSDTYAHQILPLLIDNIGHFLAGDIAALRNVVELPSSA